MVMNILDNLVSIIGNSGFYFVPILCLMASLNWRELTPGKGKQIFLIMAAVMTAGYLVLGTSSRYLLIPLILCAPLAGAGTTMLLRFLRIFRMFDWFKRRYMIWAFTVAAMVFPFWRLADRHHETVLFEFAGEMQLHAREPLSLWCVDCSHSKALGGLLMYEKNVDFYDFEENWPAAMDFLTVRQFDPQDIYFFTRLPKRCTDEDIRRWFRGKYGICPFDTVKQKNGYLLMRFNGKVLDGASASYDCKALQAWPETLSAEEFRQWARIRLPEMEMSENQPLINPDSGTADEKNVYLRLESGRMPGRCRLELRNQLGWRWAYGDFQVVPGSSQVLSRLCGQHVPHFLLNDEKPLVLDLKKYYLPQNRPELYLSNAVPHWMVAGSRFDLHPADGSAAGSGVLTYRISDRYRAQSCSGDIELAVADVSRLKQQPLNIVLIEDQFAGTLNLSHTLPQVLHPASSVRVLKTAARNENALETLNDLHLPPGKADVVLLNTFCDSFARPWTVPLKVGPYMEKHLTRAVKKLRKTYPEALIAVVLPPPPPAGASMYPYCNSPLQSRLAHYHITGELLVWHRRHEQALELLPLVLTLHPQADYQRYSTTRPVWEGYKFTAGGQQALAETAAAFLVNKLYDSK